jgi:hypothetical protein
MKYLHIDASSLDLCAGGILLDIDEVDGKAGHVLTPTSVGAAGLSASLAYCSIMSFSASSSIYVVTKLARLRDGVPSRRR